MRTGSDVLRWDPCQVPFPLVPGDLDCRLQVRCKESFNWLIGRGERGRGKSYPDQEGDADADSPVTSVAYPMGGVEHRSIIGESYARHRREKKKSEKYEDNYGETANFIVHKFFFFFEK